MLQKKKKKQKEHIPPQNVVDINFLFSCLYFSLRHTISKYNNVPVQVSQLNNFI